MNLKKILSSLSLIGALTFTASASGGKTQEKTDGRDLKSTKAVMPKQSRFDLFFGRMKKFEGGYACRNIDQPTNMGIIMPTLTASRLRHPEWKLPKNVKDLKEEHVKKIIFEEFYQKYKIDQIQDDAIAFALFDGLINTSPKNPVLWMQKAVNKVHGKKIISEDGIIGEKTVEALNALRRFEVRNSLLLSYTNQRIDFVEAKTGAKYRFGVKDRCVNQMEMCLAESCRVEGKTRSDLTPEQQKSRDLIYQKTYCHKMTNRYVVLWMIYDCKLVKQRAFPVLIPKGKEGQIYICNPSVDRVVCQLQCNLNSICGTKLKTDGKLGKNTLKVCNSVPGNEYHSFRHRQVQAQQRAGR